MQVQFFIPCFVNQFYPNVGKNMIKIFKHLNIEPIYNPKQGCCGQVAFNSGKWDDAAKMASKFIGDFEINTPIVAPSASCTAYLKNYYTKLFDKDSNEILQLEQLTSNMYELSDFLVNKLNATNFKAEFPHTVTYHDSCSGLREYGLTNEARILLKEVKGLTLIEMENNRECCGFGGTFAVKHKHISQAMVQQKIEYALKTGAEYITSTETSCLMNIEGYIRKNKLPIKAIHFTDIITNII